MTLITLRKVSFKTPPTMKKPGMFLYLIILNLYASAQTNCNWQTLDQDGFEFTTPIPDLLPGVANHSSPMPSGFANGYVTYAGNYAMYLNFIDCNGGLGTCAGAKVYERTYPVCQGMPVRIRAWMTTMFNGAGYLQSNLKLVIRDANGVMLDSVPALSIPFRTTGGWIEYISGAVTANTPTILFQMFTNVDGGQGNDLTVDELRLQGCTRTGSAQAATICSNVLATDLYSYLPANSVTNGTWSGPTVLTGGHLGIFTTGTNATGTYLYTSTPYGTGTGCPARTDSVIAISGTPPIVNLPADTTLCLNQTLTVNAGGSSNTYLWSNGATTSGITASTGGGTPSTITYSVTVTNQSGCSTRDSVVIAFINCTGLGENVTDPQFTIYPNPARKQISISTKPFSSSRSYQFILNDHLGRLVYQSSIDASNVVLELPDLSPGLYLASLRSDHSQLSSRLILIE